jgi:hypothetical protein
VIAMLFLPNSVFGQVENPQNHTSADCCWQAGAVQLSAAQMKARLRHALPISSPLLWSSMRITNAVLVFKIGTDEGGNMTCIRAISGHPIIMAAAIQSIRKWKFRPTTIGRQRQPIVGTLILSVSAAKRGIEAIVLKEVPPQR